MKHLHQSSNGLPCGCCSLLASFKTGSQRSAFTQGQLPEPIYLELPPGYQKANPHLSDSVMKITTNCLLCLYVDDAILHAREDKTLDEVLNAIAECGYAFDHDEDFNSYLGVKVDHNPDGSKTLSQPGLARHDKI
eukprot:scaffold4831_cov95-Amphora_coffeaeformis.AAC.1